MGLLGYLTPIAKIIPLFEYTSRPLTPLMLTTLEAACSRQLKGEPIGQADLDGSFMALLKRGFIDGEMKTIVGGSEVLWYVTDAGITALNASSKMPGSENK